MKQLAAAPSRNPVQFRNPPGLYDPVPNGYSHMAIVNTPSRMLLLSGQGGEDERGELAPEFRAQVRQALANVSIALAAGGMSHEHVARLTLLVVDHDESRLKVFGEEMALVFQSGMMPACTLIPVPRLALDGMLVEIEATAYA